MRTKTTKQLEVMSFEKLSTFSILAGASRVLYKRHEMGILYLSSIIAWTWAFYQALK